MGFRSQWNSAQMNNLQPGQLIKSQSLASFLSYQLYSTANTAHLPQKWAKWAELAVLFSSKTDPKFLIFSIAMGAEPSFLLKSIAT